MAQPFIVTARVRGQAHSVAVDRFALYRDAKLGAAATLNSKPGLYDRVAISYAGIIIATNGAID